MEQRLAAVFAFAQAGTNLRREVLAGVTTFVTMAYTLSQLNPAILKAAGIPEGAVDGRDRADRDVLGTLVMGSLRQPSLS